MNDRWQNILLTIQRNALPKYVGNDKQVEISKVENIGYDTGQVKVTFSTLNMFFFSNVSYCKNFITKALLSKNCY
jgi:hypothetical protein